MAIFCITTSNPKFQKLLAESGEKQGVFAMMVSKWMTENEVYDRYPTLQELGITAMDSIKPGVQELFKSNFLIFAESKTSDEVISKLLSNKIIDKKCN